MPSLRLNPTLKKQNKLLSAPIPPAKKAKKASILALPHPSSHSASLPHPVPPPPELYTIFWRVSFSGKLVHRGLLTSIDFKYTDFASKEAQKVSEFTKKGGYTVY